MKWIFPLFESVLLSEPDTSSIEFKEGWGKYKTPAVSSSAQASSALQE